MNKNDSDEITIIFIHLLFYHNEAPRDDKL
jgi:hypothetical protein